MLFTEHCQFGFCWLEMNSAGVAQVLIWLVPWCSDHMLQLEVALCGEHVDIVFQAEIVFHAEIALMMKLSSRQ